MKRSGYALVYIWNYQNDVQAADDEKVQRYTIPEENIVRLLLAVTGSLLVFPFTETKCTLYGAQGWTRSKYKLYDMSNIFHYHVFTRSLVLMLT